MAVKARKDPKGRALRVGESYRKYDGMYIFTYTDAFGRRSYLYSKDLGVLRAKEDVFNKDRLDGLDIYVLKKADVNYVFDRYIQTKTEIRDNTYRGYVYTYDHFVRDTFGKKRIAEVRYSDVISFYNGLLEKTGMTVASLEAVHTVLHPTFDMAVRDDIIRKNPSSGAIAEVKKKNWGRESGVRHALTLEQQTVFMNELQRPENHRWEPILTVLLGTGCRISEVIGLRWDDIDLEKKTISINHTVAYYPNRGGADKSEYHVSLPKTKAGVRIIPMLPAVHDAFIEEKALQEVMGVYPIDEIDGMKNFIFCNRFGHLQNRSTVNRAIKRITEDYNAREVIQAKKEKREPILIPHFSCHHARHTFCTRFCERETNIKVIQSIMGHADVSTTMNIYAEATEQAKAESFENLANNLDIFRTCKKESEEQLAI